MKRTFLQKILTLTCIIFFICSGVAFTNPFEETVRMLENRTAFHWGRDCFVWVVHYSELLVDPWVEAEAGRIGMSDTERASYKDSFISDLSIGSAEPVLVTVHAFGVRPLDFSPFSEKIALVTPNGERIKPTKYDRTLDQPLNGVVQGLVFFPKQNDPDFAIAISGMGVYDERIFSFTNEAPALNYVSTPMEEDSIEVIVVELPPVPARTSPAPVAQARSELQAPPQPQRQPEPQLPVEESINSQSVINGTETTEAEVIVIEPDKPAEDDKTNIVFDSTYSSRDQALRTFLDLWVKFDTETMYSMLSESSQKRFTKQTFEVELRRSTDFRTALRGGYRIDWLGADQAKIVTARRILLIRTLLSRNLGVTREGAAWKIVW